jgi:hypothetical protein
MKKAKKIAQKVLVLGLDILLFTWQVVRRVILPTRSRKGNLLSSLLTFFVGLLERIVSFEESILQRPVVFTHKYVKQGLIIAVGFLFLLSSFEWTIASPADTTGSGSQEVVVYVPVAASVGTVTPRPVDHSIFISSEALATGRYFLASRSPSRTQPPVTGKRWLRLRVFRI